MAVWVDVHAMLDERFSWTVGAIVACRVYRSFPLLPQSLELLWLITRIHPMDYISVSARYDT